MKIKRDSRFRGNDVWGLLAMTKGLLVMTIAFYLYIQSCFGQWVDIHANPVPDRIDGMFF